MNASNTHDVPIVKPERTVRLVDGRRLRLRQPQEGDAARLLNLSRSFSASTMFSILYKSLRAGSRTTLERYTRTDDPTRYTLMAEIVSEANGEPSLLTPLVGVAHYWRIGRDGANMTIAVGDPWQGLGIGRELLQALVFHAQEEGIVRLRAFFDADNSRMLAVLERCGLQTQKLEDPEGAWEILLGENR